MKNAILVALAFMSVLSEKSFAEVEAHPPCRVVNRYVGYLEGEDEALFDSLVSKFPKEQLSPLAQPKPIRPFPVEYVNPVNQAYFRQNGRSEYMQEDAALNAMTMIRKAYENGVRIFVYSAYRSYQQQCEVFRSKVSLEMKSKNLSADDAIKLVNIRSAFPGESEHQLGTTMDVVSDDHEIGYKLKFEFAKTRAYEWLQKNAVDYGFVLSYPMPKSGNPYAPHPETKIIFEPWHWRYVGVTMARQYKQCSDKMTPQEFLRNVKKTPGFTCQ